MIIKHYLAYAMLIIKSSNPVIVCPDQRITTFEYTPAATDSDLTIAEKY